LRRGQQSMMMQGEKTNLVKVNGIEVDITNIQHAIKLIKLRYMYDVILKQAI
jgi:hypothetical protein